MDPSSVNERSRQPQFLGFLAQALTLGLKRTSRERAPQLVGLIVYASVIGLMVLVAPTLRQSEQNLKLALAAALVLLFVVLLIGFERHIYRWVFNAAVLVLLAAIATMIVSAFASIG